MKRTSNRPSFSIKNGACKESRLLCTFCLESFARQSSLTLVGENWIRGQDTNKSWSFICNTCGSALSHFESEYIHLYITGVAFPGPWARNLQISQRGPGAKIEVLVLMLSMTCSMCFGRPWRLVLGSFCGLFRVSCGLLNTG